MPVGIRSFRPLSSSPLRVQPNQSILIFSLHPFLQWLASGFMEYLRMKLASSNSNSASIFLCKVSQTGISPASILPFEF